MSIPISTLGTTAEEGVGNAAISVLNGETNGGGMEQHPFHHPHTFSRVNSCIGGLGQPRNSVVEWNHKEITSLVKKSWKSSYVECSAAYNWNIVTVFKELAITLTAIANGQVIGSQSSSNPVKKKRCLMF